jgi:nickel-dependent lactate racemase
MPKGVEQMPKGVEHPRDVEHHFELPEELFVASWRGPAGLGTSEQLSLIREGLENPRNFPPLRQAVVPGDRVVVAWDPTIGEAGPILEALAQLFAAAGVEDGGLTVLTTASGRGILERILPRDMALAVHDPDDRTQLAYLATTKHGRRIYLNRLLTDADLVVPVGRLGFDSVLGYRGPWSVLFPSLSDRATLRASREGLRDEPVESSRGLATPWLAESFEVSWLLGTQFHLGLVPGSSGLFEIVAGLETTVRDLGIATLEQHWRFDVDSRAELVVVEIGRPGVDTSIEDLAEGLATAARLVQHGGKIVVLSRVVGEIGPALKRLIDADDPKKAAAILRGHEGDDDFVAARQLAHALSRADVFLLSRLPQRLVEDLSMVAIEHPEQARRIVSQSGSCLLVSQAELTRAVVRSDQPA